MTCSYCPSFRTHQQYFLLKPGICGVEKSVDAGLLLTLRFLFAVILSIHLTIQSAHRNDGPFGQLDVKTKSNSARLCDFVSLPILHSQLSPLNYLKSIHHPQFNLIINPIPSSNKILRWTIIKHILIIQRTYHSPFSTKYQVFIIPVG